jgi:hypothetical protein
MGNHIHHATNRTTAVKEGRRPAHDLDPLHQKRLNTDRVIRTDDGGIAGADTILEQADAITTQAADDRAARAGAKRGRLDASLGRQRVAKRSLFFQPQRLAGQNRGRLRQVDLVASERSRGSDELIEDEHTGRVCGRGRSVGMGRNSSGGDWRLRAAKRSRAETRKEKTAVEDHDEAS